MLTEWQTLFSAQGFTGVMTKTSGGLYCPSAEGIDFEFTGATSSLSAIKVLFDPADNGAALFSDTSNQPNAPDLATIPETGGYDFADVIGQTLGTNPLLGGAIFVRTINGVTIANPFRYHYVYLQVTSTATLTLTVRASVRYPDIAQARQTNFLAVAGSVV